MKKASWLCFVLLVAYSLFLTAYIVRVDVILGEVKEQRRIDGWHLYYHSKAILSARNDLDWYSKHFGVEQAKIKKRLQEIGDKK